MLCKYGNPTIKFYTILDPSRKAQMNTYYSNLTVFSKKGLLLRDSTNFSNTMTDGLVFTEKCNYSFISPKQIMR